MSTVVIGGTGGLGREIARHYMERGREVVISGRDPGQAEQVAAELGGKAAGIGLDLTRPEEIGAALSGIGEVESLVLAAISRDQNSVADYEIAAAIQLTTMKLIGYTEVVHTLRNRLAADAGIVIFGGQARVRPYPGSTTVTTVNAGVEGMVRAFSTELAPIRVNAIHPGIVGDSPFWSAKPPEVLEAIRSGTLTGRLVTMREITDAVVFLLENGSVNGISLVVDGGWR